MADHADIAADSLPAIPAALLNAFGGLFAPDSRFFPPYLIVAIGLAALAYFANRKRLSEKRRGGFLAYLFDREMYLHPSSLVDFKITLANRLFAPFLSLAGRGAIIVSAQSVAALLLGREPLGAGRPVEEIGLFTLAVVTVAVALASDLTTYVVHRIHHENPALWPFHKVHHSAETMTPVTFARKHPAYDLFRALSNAAILGPVQGMIFAAFGITNVMVILGVNAIYAAFHWTGSNLRHTHVWLSYGPFWSRIFISPAQHQIHHSCAPRHHDKNYGEIFAFWDWMFGTLYVPETYEPLEFGVADENGARLPQPHPTLKDAWLVPFRESAAALKEGRRRAVDAPSSSV